MLTLSRWTKLTALAVALSVFPSCGGGGGGGGGDSAVSGYVPYLISAPVVTYKANSLDSAKYDVTVTLEADGPTGVMFVSLWIMDVTNSSNFAPLDLNRITGTKRWTGTTNSLIPLPSGQYYVEDIHLDDGDIFTADPLRSGWYFSEPFFSTSRYYVDEREKTSQNPFNFYNFGVSGITITRFTLP